MSRSCGRYFSRSVKKFHTPAVYICNRFLSHTALSSSICFRIRKRNPNYIAQLNVWHQLNYKPKSNLRHQLTGVTVKGCHEAWMPLCCDDAKERKMENLQRIFYVSIKRQNYAKYLKIVIRPHFLASWISKNVQIQAKLWPCSSVAATTAVTLSALRS